MAEARSRDNWAHTSAVLALIANVNRDPKKSRPFKPADFDPYSARDRRDEAIEVTAPGGAGMAVLKDAFTGKATGNRQKATGKESGTCET